MKREPSDTVTILTEENRRLKARVEEIEKELAILRANEKLLYARAHTDPVTGLPNRHLLCDRMREALAFEKRHHKFVAVLLLDIDNFKDINDRFGHLAGDQVLRNVGNRLRSSVRGYDTIARLGGDEFVILLPDVPDEETIVKLADKVLALFAEPFPINAGEATITASIGIAVHSGEGIDAEMLLEQADEAMYRSKRWGKNTWTSTPCSTFRQPKMVPPCSSRTSPRTAHVANGSPTGGVDVLPSSRTTRFRGSESPETAR